MAKGLSATQDNTMGIVSADSNVSAVRIPAIRLRHPKLPASMYDAGDAGHAANSMTITNAGRRPDKNHDRGCYWA